MGKELSDQRIFEVIMRDKDFFKYYLRDLLNRIEEIGNNVDQIYKNFISFNDEINGDIFPDKLLNFANKINSLYRKEGLRLNDVLVKNFTPVKPEKIFRNVYSLSESYRGLWRDLTVLEREAFFHIHLMRIYPFIYNNELISLLILNSNLINNYYAPIIINSEEKDMYYQVIASGDALKFKEIIELKIKEEIILIQNLYKKYYLFPENISIEEIILKKSNY